MSTDKVETDSYTGSNDVIEISNCLESFRNDGVEIFSKLLKNLDHMRDVSVLLTEELSALSNHSTQSSNACNALEELRCETKSLACIFRKTDSSLNIKSVKSYLKKMNYSLSSLKPQSKRLSMIASLSAITSASLGVNQLDDHISLLRRISISLASNFEQVEVQIENVATAIENSERELKSGRELIAAKLANDGNNRIIEEGGSLLSRMSVQTQKISLNIIDTTKVKLKYLISSMQYSDAFSQRLEHVIEMLFNEMPGAVPIAASQIEKLVEDQVHTHNEIKCALDGLNEVCRLIVKKFETKEFDAAVEVAIEDINKSLALGVKTISDVKSVVNRTRHHLSNIGPACDAAVVQFSALSDTFVELNLSAINVALKPEAGGDAQNGLFTLSEDVRAVAAETGRDVAIISNGLNVLQGNFKPDILNELVSSLATFEKIAENCNAVQRSVRDTKNGRAAIISRARDLSQAIIQACSTLDPLTLLTKNIMSESSNLSCLSEDFPFPDESQSIGIFNLYTMDREREIHESILGCSVSVSEKNLQNDAVDDDGFEAF